MSDSSSVVGVEGAEIGVVIESKFAKDVEFRFGIVVENDYVVLEEEDCGLVRNFDRFDEVSNVAMWLRPWNYL